jgi:uncharacterized protein YecE (DUF72 family)
MQFGQVENPGLVDFALPDDHPDTRKVLAKQKPGKAFHVWVGCAKWNKKDLKGFYPRGVPDELAYYAGQFNSIELNATFYHSPDAGQVEAWRNKTPEGFRFYPKVPATISHYKRLTEFKAPLKAFTDAITHFDDRLGIPFLQLHDNFKPKDFDRIEAFMDLYPEKLPLAVEPRNTAWFNPGGEDAALSDSFFELLKTRGREAVLVDTLGRRDILHMRLTTGAAFIRFVGANHPTDYVRLDDWVKRIALWREQGLKSLHFFVHQHVEKESPLLSAHFIKNLNKTFNLNLKVPVMA